MNPFVMMHKLIFRPFDFFEDIQQPGVIKISHAIYLIVAAFIARVLSIYLTSFTFETREPYQVSIFQEAIWIFIPWLTWCVAHWAVSAILDGEGKFVEIIYGSAFALLPYTLLIVPLTLLTQILSLDESGIYMILINVILYWVVWLILLKVKILHNFDIPKTLFITLLSVIAVLILWFVCILMFGLANQFIYFFVEIWKELRLRN